MTDFIELLGLPFLVCLTMIGILGHLGIHVLKREIIFIDIALAQVVAVGAITAHLLFHVHGDSIVSYICAFSFALMAAAFYSVVRRKIVQIPLEAVIGVTYAIAAAAALFLVGIAPGGHLHVHEMLAGSMLWATWKDLLVCVVVFSAVGFGSYIFRKPFARISNDYEAAVQERLKVVWWDFLFYSLLGLVITVAVGIAGVVVVFALLIIPATASAVFASGWGRRLVITWGIGVCATAAGLAFSYSLDFSVGPAIAMFLGFALILCAILKALPRGIAAAVTCIAVLGLAVLFLFGRPAGLSVGHHGGVVESPGAGSPEDTTSHASTTQILETPTLEQIERLDDLEKIEELLEEAVGADIACGLVIRTLNLNPRAGARLAIGYLRDNPPCFFFQQVADRLDEIAQKPVGFNPEKSFHSEVNQKAVTEVKKLFGLK